MVLQLLRAKAHQARGFFIKEEPPGSAPKSDPYWMPAEGLRVSQAKQPG